MNESDSANFDITLSQLFRTMGKPVPDADIKLVWWEIFLHVELHEFATACAEYVRVEDRTPVPAAVRRYLPRRIAAQRMLSYQRSPSDVAGRKRAVDLLRECQRRLESGRQDA